MEMFESKFEAQFCNILLGRTWSRSWNRPGYSKLVKQMGFHREEDVYNNALGNPGHRLWHR